MLYHLIHNHLTLCELFAVSLTQYLLRHGRLDLSQFDTTEWEDFCLIADPFEKLFSLVYDEFFLGFYPTKVKIGERMIEWLELLIIIEEVRIRSIGDRRIQVQFLDQFIGLRPSYYLERLAKVRFRPLHLLVP